MIDLDSLSIVHYCHPRCRPFLNIMRLPREEAFAVAAKLAADNRETTAFYRFADFEHYYPRRAEADALMYERFSALGFCPAQRHPLSFVLEGSEYLREWFGGGAETRLPLEGIPENAVSFTFGDSMGILKRKQPLEVVTKPMLRERLLAYPGEKALLMKEIEESCRYIEAQVWDDACVRGAISD